MDRELIFVRYISRPETMFAKLEQHSWIKVEVARVRSTQERFQGTR